VLALLRHLRLFATHAEVTLELKRLRQGGAARDWKEVLVTPGGKSFEMQVKYIYGLMDSNLPSDKEALANLRKGYNTNPKWQRSAL
jgi:hypothetical protein